jgi:hypothetical protein
MNQAAKWAQRRMAVDDTAAGGTQMAVERLPDVAEVDQNGAAGYWLGTNPPYPLSAGASEEPR